MYRKLPALLLLICLGFTGRAQYLEWAGQQASSASPGGQGYAVCVDPWGNVYTTGYLQGTADFDPGPGVFNLTTAGQMAYMQKLDKNGNFVWAKLFSGTGSTSIARGITADSFGGIYFTGGFGGGMDADPNAGTHIITATAGYDIFLIKLDTGGNYRWAKSFGGSANDYGESVTTDRSGNVYVCGYFVNSADFDGGPGTFMLSAGGTANSNAFLEKLDSAGNFIWAKDLGASAGSGLNVSSASSVALDYAGNIFVTGGFKNTIDFDPGTGTTLLTSWGGTSHSNCYVSKLDNSGNLIWVKQIGGTVDCGGTALATDPAGSVIIVGSFNYTIDLDPGAGVVSITDMSGGYNNSWIEKLDVSGNFKWGSILGSADILGVMGVCVDQAGNSYNTGFFRGTTDFDPGTGVYALSTSGSNNDNYIQKLDSNGNFLWARQIEGANAQADGMAIDSKRNIYLTGFFNGTYDFDPGPGTFSMSSGTFNNTFTMKIYQYKYGDDVAAGCGSYTLAGNTITASGTYLDTLTAALGMDSIVSVEVTINTIPSPGTISGTDSVCKTGTRTLTESVTGGIWGATNGKATVAAGVVSGVTVGTDTIFYVVNNGLCADTARFPMRVVVCNKTGIETESTDAVAMRISPNPGRGEFHIAISGEFTDLALLTVTDVLGRKIKEQLLPVENAKETTLVLDAAPGVYFFNVVVGGKRWSEKVVLVR
jgi:Beta-propeller repeat